VPFTGILVDREGCFAALAMTKALLDYRLIRRVASLRSQ
jgi:hypothetical protein